jgi:hypothetical protein
LEIPDLIQMFCVLIYYSWFTDLLKMHNNDGKCSIAFTVIVSASIGMSRFESAHPDGTVGHLPFNPTYPVLTEFPSKLLYLKHPVVDFVALP